MNSLLSPAVKDVRDLSEDPRTPISDCGYDRMGDAGLATMNQAGVLAWAIWVVLAVGVAWEIVEILHMPPAYEKQHDDSAEESLRTSYA